MTRLRMQTDEGHLGGYILDGAAPGTWCPGVWDWAIHDLGVSSVIDVGCGLGYAAKYFKDHGCRVTGIEGSPTAVRDSAIPGDVVQYDYCDGPYIPAEAVDLIWSAEFVEHVEERFAGNFLTTFESATRYLMITYAAPGQGGHHHVNEQPEAYWLDRMSEIGFQKDAVLTSQARALVGDHPKIGKHFRARGLVFVNEPASRPGPRL